MSPVQDPRFSAARREQIAEKDREMFERAARAEVTIPLAILGVCGIAVLGHDVLAAGWEGAAVRLVYYIIQLLLGVLGLWVAATLWLGGAGPLSLAVLRLAAIYTVYDLILIGATAMGLAFLAWFICAVVYISLLAWLFDLEWMDALILAVVTFVIKVAVGAALLVAFAA
jgi:hypothetical protein